MINQKIKIIGLLYIMCFGFVANSQNNTLTIPKLSEELLEDGWHRKEIDRLTQFYIHENSGVTSSKDKKYTPRPLPKNTDQLDLKKFNRWLELYAEEYEKFNLNFKEAYKTYEIKYADKIEPYEKIHRENGLWKYVKMNPTAGRIYDLEIHPKDSKTIYANPDGDGIFITKDGGFNWRSITDNIPDRLQRNSYENIIVDPVNFEHVFSVSRFGNMYETIDGGSSWEHIVNANHDKGLAPQFKWVEAFRNSENQLIIIGTVTKNNGLNNNWEKGVYRSVDSGKSWNKIQISDSGFQEMDFHKTNRDIIYLANTSKLYKSVNSGQHFELVYDFKNGNRPMFISTLGKNDADKLYVVISQKDNTQVYFSSDQGLTWELRQDSENEIGYNKGIFGSYGSSGWTSFFEVDPFNPLHLIASSVGSCESFDGGVNWELQSWSKRADAQMPNKTIVPMPHAGHNADNHVLKFHPVKEGLMIKGCDAGIMKKETGDDNWININGNMPAFLWYSVVVNEFGDRYIAGNTQDVNIQTYRYNTWENERGYEGDAIFMNPSTNVSYFPTAKTEKGEGLNFLEPGFWKMHSWNYPKVAVNYKNLDQIFIAYGRRPIEKDPQLPKYLYVSNDRGVSFNRVPNMNDQEVFSVNVSRNNIPILTAFTENEVMQSDSFGNNWVHNGYPEELLGNKKSRKLSGAVNPEDPNQLWVGGKDGKVFNSIDGGQTWTSIKGTLPKGDVVELLFHEGTKGDLYALVKGFGVFYLAEDSSDWKLWMKGFNLTDFTEIRIDYPTQKLLASSYGRGLWECDLEKQVDRFFGDNLEIISGGKVNNKYIFEIDTELTIPSYYKYTWFLNGEVVGKDSNTLLIDKISKNDIVKLELVPIYAIDVKASASLVITDKIKGVTIKANSEFTSLTDSYISAGYVGLFGPNQNFTIGTWIKPTTKGIIAANRRAFYRDAKGWYLEIDDKGKLSFNAAFYQNRSLDRTYQQGNDQSITVVSNGEVLLNKWQHIAVSIQRNGSINLYVDSQLVGTKNIAEIPENISLNNVMNLTLMADSYGKRKLNGDLRSFSIYGKDFSKDEINHVMKKGNFKSESLEFHIYNSKEHLESLYKTNNIKLIKKGSEKTIQ